jgi:hypothetical protein
MSKFGLLDRSATSALSSMRRHPRGDCGGFDFARYQR